MALLYPLPKRTTIRAASNVVTKGRAKPIRLLVIHDGETNEGSTPAEGMGAWFASGKAGGSAHAGFDTDSICTYVDDGDTAWGAPGANSDGLHGELAGRASQTVSQWKDSDSLRIIENGAIWFAEKSLKHGIPARYLTDAQVADGRTEGITSHRQITRALRRGTHTDPGPNFPFDYFLSRVKFHLARLTTPAAPEKAPTPIPKPIAQEAPTMFLVQLQNTDPVYKSDGFRRIHVDQTQRDALLSAGVKLTVVKTAKALDAFGPEVKA